MFLKSIGFCALICSQKLQTERFALLETDLLISLLCEAALNSFRGKTGVREYFCRNKRTPSARRTSIRSPPTATLLPPPPCSDRANIESAAYKKNPSAAAVVMETRLSTEPSHHHWGSTEDFEHPKTTF